MILQIPLGAEYELNSSVQENSQNQRYMHTIAQGFLQSVFPFVSKGRCPHAVHHHSVLLSSVIHQLCM